MYLRFIHISIEEPRLKEVQSFYQERVIPDLEAAGGCRFASLLQSTSDGSRCASLTLWDAAEQADAWATSDRFRQILEDGSPLLSGASSWQGALTDTSVPEAAVRTFTIEAGEQTRPNGALADQSFFRITSFRVREGAWDDLVRLYDQEVIPTLLSMQGCRSAFLIESTEDPDRGLSVSIWDREEDAIRYEISGNFDLLTRKLKDTLTPTPQWQTAVTSEGTAQGNPPTEGYRIIVGFQL